MKLQTQNKSVGIRIPTVENEAEITKIVRRNGLKFATTVSSQSPMLADICDGMACLAVRYAQPGQEDVFVFYAE